MDSFVYNKLKDWGLEHWTKSFQEAKVDTQRLYCLEEHEIDNLIYKIGPRAKFKKQLQGLKIQQKCYHGKCIEETSEETSFAEVSSCTCCTDKDDCSREEEILESVQKIMMQVEEKMSKDTTELCDFRRNEINNLKVEKRELVGVFGQTGAGKSSLINAVVGEKDLLPTGSLSACTTVMIKVETAQTKQYEAEIDFITVMEWEDELWSAKKLFMETQGSENDDEDNHEYIDLTEKLDAFYGDICWKNRSVENLMHPKYFREIPEFLNSMKKTFPCKTVSRSQIVTSIHCNDSLSFQAKELTDKISVYTRSDVMDLNQKFWPLVKCVTVRVPCNALLKHVTLVDLPGNGDRNRSRDQMWTEIIGSCSTVWIVTNMNRAAADRDAWEILKSACGLIENGGICQNIHFICTKTDMGVDEEGPEVQRDILVRNMSAKSLVMQEIKKVATLKKYLRENCFEVFTVSSKEFLKPKYLKPNQTEIPKLRAFLHCLNGLHGQTLNYVSGARRILFHMKEASANLVQQRSQLVAELNKITKDNLLKLKTSMCNACMTLEKCLSNGVENSKLFCLESLWEKNHSASGSAVSMALKCAENSGVYRPNHREAIDINSALSIFLTQSIQEEFRRTFPCDGKSGFFYGAIHELSLGTTLLMQKYQEHKLQLIFIGSQEKTVKLRLVKIIRNRKKMLYNSLIQTVEDTMQKCYKEAAILSGKGRQERIRQTLKSYVQEVKDTMFDCAKDNLLTQLQTLMDDVLNTVSESLHKSIKQSLIEEKFIPDISRELDEVTKHYNELISTDGEDDLLLSDSDMDIL